MPPLVSNFSDGDEMLDDSDSADDFANRIIIRKHWRKYLAAQQSLSAEIHNLNIPVCYHDPSLTEDDRCEVLDTYLQETVFHAKVWINYDPSGRKFYNDKRMQNCGKMRLTDAQRAHLDRKPMCDFPIEQMVFTLGTPFLPFCRVSFRVKVIEDEAESNDNVVVKKHILEVRGTSWVIDLAKHHDLETFVRSVCHDMDGGQLRTTTGMNVHVLHKMAEFFLKRPDDNGGFWSDKCRMWYGGAWQTSGMAKVQPRTTPLSSTRRQFPRDRAYKTARIDSSASLQHIRFPDEP